MIGQRLPEFWKPPLGKPEYLPRTGSTLGQGSPRSRISTLGQGSPGAGGVTLGRVARARAGGVTLGRVARARYQEEYSGQGRPARYQGEYSGQGRPGPDSRNNTGQGIPGPDSRSNTGQGGTGPGLSRWCTQEVVPGLGSHGGVPVVVYRARVLTGRASVHPELGRHPESVLHSGLPPCPKWSSCSWAWVTLPKVVFLLLPGPG